MSEDAEWHDWRGQGWTSTDAARSWTGYYGGAYGAVAEKLGLAGRDIDPARANVGHSLEEPIADAVHSLKGWWVQGEQMLVTNPDTPLHRATIDGLLSEFHEVPSLDDCPAGLEVKTRFLGADNWPWPYWTTQCQWAMHVTGRNLWLLAIAVVDHNTEVARLEFRWVERDQDLIDRLADQANILWRDFVLKERLPDPDTPSALSAVKEVNRAAAAGEAPDIDDLAAVVERYDHISANLPRWKEERDELAARIRHRMGASTQAVAAERWRVKVGEPIRKWTDMARLELELFFPRDEHPDFYKTVLDHDVIDTYPELGDRFKEPTTDRRLTVKDLTA